LIMASVEEITRIITDTITDALAPIKRDITEMKTDIESLKEDMSKVSTGFKNFDGETGKLDEGT